MSLEELQGQFLIDLKEQLFIRNLFSSVFPKDFKYCVITVTWRKDFTENAHTR
jgi:hypothetical protein